MKRRLGILVGLALSAALPAYAQAAERPFAAGERITWDVRYAAVRAGTAWATVEQGEGNTLVFRGGARNAPWYGRIYTVDDEISSVWDPEGPGSSCYVTRFREGRFAQDQRMDIGIDVIRVWRKQRFKEGWREWTEDYEGWGEPVEDPQSALYRIRLLPLAPDEVYRFPIFSGRKTWMLHAVVEQRKEIKTALGQLRVVPVSLRTSHKGDLEQKGKLTVYLSDDERRIPVRVVLHSNIGAIRAELSTYVAAPEPSTPEVGRQGGEGIP